MGRKGGRNAPFLYWELTQDSEGQPHYSFRFSHFSHETTRRRVKGSRTRGTAPLRRGHLGGLFLCLVFHVWILHPFDAQTCFGCPLSSC